MAKQWHICSVSTDKKDDLEFIEWGTVVALFNPCSGDTHLLNLFPYEIISFLLLKPASSDRIVAHMSVLCDEKNDQKWQQKILSMLQQLKDLELIDYQS